MRQKSGPAKGTGGKDRERHPAGDTPAILGRREDPHRPGGPPRRGEHRRAVSSRRDRPEPLLSLVEGLPGSRQEAAGWRHGTGRDLGRGQGPSPRSVGSEGGRGRTDSRKPSAQKKRDRGWGGCGMRYPACEKLEIIQLVEQSHLPVRRTLEKLGIPRATSTAGMIFITPAGPKL